MPWVLGVKVCATAPWWKQGAPLWSRFILGFKNRSQHLCQSLCGFQANLECFSHPQWTGLSHSFYHRLTDAPNKINQSNNSPGTCGQVQLKITSGLSFRFRIKLQVLKHHFKRPEQLWLMQSCSAIISPPQSGLFLPDLCRSIIWVFWCGFIIWLGLPLFTWDRISLCRSGWTQRLFWW